MKYKVMYLPNGLPITDGCEVITADGDNYAYDKYEDYKSSVGIKAASIYIVKSVFNQDVIVGKPSPDALKWLKPGMEIKSADCELWWFDEVKNNFDEKIKYISVFLQPPSQHCVVRVHCEICGHLH